MAKDVATRGDRATLKFDWRDSGIDGAFRGTKGAST
jgi:hypothetical protein